MDTFRCPTCIAIIVDTSARRCPMCQRRLRPQRLTVLGDDTRIGAHTLLVDDWMLQRIESSGEKKDGMEVKPVAWHDRFTTMSSAGIAYHEASGSVVVADSPTVTAPAPAPAPAATPAPEPVATTETVEASAAVDAAVDTVVVTTEETLDPEVKSIIDELYQKARGDDAGDSVND